MRIAIVGSHPEHWMSAPFGDPAWSIWGFSRRNFGKLPRCDVWFELHDKKNFRNYDISCKGYTDWLKACPSRITQANFPKDRLLERFGPYFFGHGQAPWIMAYAIYQEPETIGLWGMEGVAPYKGQLPEIQHFVQAAADLGIEVIAPAESEILEPHKLYAFS